MTWLQALILGLVEGLTEYLPVSSTGHLLLTQKLMALKGDLAAANAYAICIQGGAILAVLSIYHQRFKSICLGLLGKDPDGLRLLGLLLTAFMPAAIIGLLLDDHIEHYLFGPWPIIFAWVVGSLAIIFVDRHLQRPPKETTLASGSTLSELPFSYALLIGLAQTLALWPGTSRSLVTILMALVLRLSKKDAIEFSFLLGVVTLGAATVYKMYSSGEIILANYSLTTISIGVGAAWLSAMGAIAWLLAYLQNHSLKIFVYWRLLLAALASGLIFTGHL